MRGGGGNFDAASVGEESGLVAIGVRAEGAEELFPEIGPLVGGAVEDMR